MSRLLFTVLMWVAVLPTADAGPVEIISLHEGDGLLLNRDSAGCTAEGMRPVDLFKNVVRPVASVQHGQLYVDEAPPRTLHVLVGGPLQGRMSVQTVRWRFERDRLYFDNLSVIEPFFDCDLMSMNSWEMQKLFRSLKTRLARQVFMELSMVSLHRRVKYFTCEHMVGLHAAACIDGDCDAFVGALHQVKHDGCIDRFFEDRKPLLGWEGQHPID